MLLTTASFSRVSEGWMMVARGNSDDVVGVTTTTPTIVKVAHLSVTRHWQDNGKSIIR